MKSKTIKTFLAISEEIGKYIKSKNRLCVKRAGKNDITDALLYKLLYTQANTTQEKTTIKLNNLKKKYKKASCTSSRQALAKKEKLLDVSFYTDLSDMLAKFINKYTCKDPYTQQIIAVDGTHSTLLSSLSMDGHKPNKNKGSVTPLISGLFNVTSNYPVTLDMVKTKDERSAFKNFRIDKTRYDGNIFVFDRGYYSDEMVDFMVDNKFKFVFRLKKNSTLISNTLDKINIVNGTKIRVVTYNVNNKKFYCATNLFDSPIEQIKSIYHDRWTIEEYFKYTKKYLCMAKMNEHRHNDINKTIYAQLIISQITYLFDNMHKTNKDKQHYFKNKIITDKNNKNNVLNKSILTDGLFGDFLFNFFNNTKFTKYYMINFLATFIKFCPSNLNISNERVCKRANYKWYYKTHTDSIT